MRTNDKALADLKVELKKSYDVMNHLRRKISGNHTDSAQFNSMMKEIQQVLEIPIQQEVQKEVKSPLKTSTSPVQELAFRQVTEK